MPENDLENQDIERGISSAKALGFNVRKVSAMLPSYFGLEVKIAMAVVIIAVALPLLMISVFPIGDLFHSSSEIETVEDNLALSVQSAYSAEVDSSKEQALKFVNDNYDQNAGLSDIINFDSGYRIDTDTCLITVTFYPSLNEVKGNIAAYINAVNGTIAFLGEKTREELKNYESGSNEKPEVFQGKVMEKDSDGFLVMTYEAMEFYKAHSDELTDITNEDYIKSIGLYSQDFFSYDDDEAHWSLNNFHIAPKTHQEWQCVGHEKVYDADGKVIGTSPVYDWVNVTVDAWYGDIRILMFYDLSGFKAEELKTCADISGFKYASGAYVDGVSLVSSVLNDYYNSYISAFHGGSDNRSEYFRSLLDDGVLMYIPISGLTGSFIEGQPGYTGDAHFSDWDNKGSKEIWSEISLMRKKGVIGYRTAMWNCTAFAQAWFYKLYGVNALYGDGRNMVSNLLNPGNALCGDWGATLFYRASSPAPGGIFSISSPGGGNHVGCVDAVDYENKTITFSDGNTNSRADSSSTISIKRTLTFAQFESYVKACCLRHGSTVGATVTFANPILNISSEE